MSHTDEFGSMHQVNNQRWSKNFMTIQINIWITQ